jgi:hypothetical protein
MAQLASCVWFLWSLLRVDVFLIEETICSYFSLFFLPCQQIDYVRVGLGCSKRSAAI